ncbi:glycosyl transferase, group 2 family protein [Cronobacter condimenti 1330]|uniref:Glycosyl transferase n=1 Tax=Cronobacter condimenti 1330 TaxID=1073999 RepID=K8A4B6_9ENTR|nr:glycosyltransferase family 2 protein [Cronobacter condimenti]ALB64548.1 glycosyl transferase [Cronobacter condimenti 1330]CCJ74520.1 glycosyl transferase, group 2 family protein [Cronobacter condimenti 1330]
MISICMIVKNEAKHLAATLATVAAHFDDIVIVDTGSQDDTKAIARRFTDNVHDFAWVEDFAAARNASLQYARHDWVLVIDADEAIASVDMAALQALVAAHPEGVGRIERINYIDEGESVTTLRERVSRLFPKARYHYHGVIHEQITPREGAPAGERFLVPLTLDHIGYKKAVLQETDKIARNIRLLEHAIRKQPDDPYLWFQLGKSHFLRRDYPAAIAAFRTALGYEPNVALEYVEELVETLGYALINQGDYAAAMAIIDYERWYSSADFMFLKALILMNNGQLQAAVDTFLHCTRQPESSKTGVTSFKAWYNIGVILEISGMTPDAAACYQQCGDYAPAKAGLARLNG